jgi:5'-nucleotidase
MTLTGAQIERLLEEQFVSGGKVRDSPRILQVSEGCSFAWKAGAGVADRIDPAFVQVAGKPLALGAAYRVVVNGFLATGGDGFAVFKEGTARRVAGVEVDALADYVAKHPGLKPPVGARITTR